MTGRQPVGPALLRIALPLLMLWHWIPLISVRHLIWGNHASALLTVSIAAACLFMIGVAPRISALFFAFATSAIVYANQDVADAGQNVVVLIAYLLCLTDTTRWSVLPLSMSPRLPALRVVSETAHKAGSLLIIWQLAAIYAFAVFYKLHGTDWPHGVAIYYAVQLDQYITFPWLSRFIAAHSFAYTFADYATLAIQAFFPLFVWFKKTKHLALILAVGMHIGIALTLGLFSFSITMVLIEIATLAEDDLIHITSRIAAGLRDLSRTAVTKPLASTQEDF